MKNFKRVLVVCVAAMALASVLAGCSGGDTEDVEGSASTDAVETTASLAGNTYALASYIVDDEDLTESMTALYASQTLTFEEDGVCIQTIVWADEYIDLFGSDPVEMEGTYEEGDGTVTVTFASDEGDTVMEFTVEDGALVMEEDGSVTTYELQ